MVSYQSQFNQYRLKIVFRELLERIKAFEDHQLSGAKGDGPKLLPMNEGGGTALLKMVPLPQHKPLNPLL